MQQIPFSQARANLADTLHGVEAGNEPAIISRHGAPAAVLMSIAQYRQLSGSAQGFADKLNAWRRHHLSAPDASVAADTSDPWGDVRDTSEGRNFKW